MGVKAHISKYLFSVVLVVIIMSSIYSPAFAQSSLLQDLQVINGKMDKFEIFTHTYDVYLNDGEFYLDVVTETADETCTVEITGADYIAPDSRTIVQVNVYDPNGNFEQYQLYVYSGSAIPPEHVKTGLQFIDCTNGVIAPAYGKNVSSYYIVLENRYTHADLNIRTFSDDSEIVLEGNQDLEAGKRTRLELEIKESTGESKSYNLYIYRKALYTAPVVYERILSNLEVNSGAVDIKFSSNTYYYIANVPASVTTLDVQAIAQNRSNIVRVYGPMQMYKHQPTVIDIVVSSEKDDVISVYTLVLRYDSFFHLEKYTAFQLTMALILAGLITAAAVAFIFHLLKSRKCCAASDEQACCPKKHRRRPVYVRRRCNAGKHYCIYSFKSPGEEKPEEGMEKYPKG